MNAKIFGVQIERLLLCGEQTLYMIGWAPLLGSIFGILLAYIHLRRKRSDCIPSA